MNNQYSCPICNAKETVFFQYPLICSDCWKSIRTFNTLQLQMKLMFWSATKNNESLSQGG